MNSALKQPFSYVLDRTQSAVPLAGDELTEMAAAARRGEPEATERIVIANTRLCVHIVNLISPNGGLREDLFSAALQGMTEAVKDFDPAKGSFASYAGFFIRREIYETLSMLGYPVSAPTRLTRTRRHINEARARIEARGQEATVDRLVDEASIKRDTIIAVQFLETPSLALDGVSVDPTPAQDKYLPACERPTPASSILQSDDREWLRSAVAERLGEVEREVITRYYGLNDQPAESLACIGRSMGLTRQRLGQIADEARGKLRRAVEAAPAGGVW